MTTCNYAVDIEDRNGNSQHFTSETKPELDEIRKYAGDFSCRYGKLFCRYIYTLRDKDDQGEYICYCFDSGDILLNSCNILVKVRKVGK